MLFKFKGEIGLTFDYTNDYFNPTKGIRVMPTVGIGTNFNVKSDNSGSGNNEDGHFYTYSEATVNIYVPLFWTLYGALSGSIGSFFNQAIEDDARMFYQGGSRSVRGYRFRSVFASYTTKDTVTVKDKNGEESSEIKDNIHTALTPMYFRINEELRWTLPWKSLRSWQIVQFFDMTKVMDIRDNIYENGQEASLGLGIRYQWQFLTFRLDYAIAKGLMTNENCSDNESTSCRNNKKKKGFDWNRIAFDLSQAF